MRSTSMSSVYSRSRTGQMSDEPDSEDIIFIDTNIFVAVGGPENSTYS
jgi:hypothetical protein